MRPQLGEAESHAATGEHSLRGTTKARWERERGPVAAGEVARGRRLAMSAGALRRLVTFFLPLHFSQAPKPVPNDILFILSINKYVLRACYMPGIIRDTKSVANKQNRQHSSSLWR